MAEEARKEQEYALYCQRAELAKGQDHEKNALQEELETLKAQRDQVSESLGLCVAVRVRVRVRVRASV